MGFRGFHKCGSVNKGYLFTAGVNQSIQYTDASLNLSNNFTFFTRFSPTVNNIGGQILICWGDESANQRRSIILWNGGAGNSRVWFSGYAANLDSTIDVEIGKYYNCVVTVSAASLVTIYMDGISVASGTLTLNAFTYEGTFIGSSTTKGDNINVVMDTVGVATGVVPLGEHSQLFDGTHLDLVLHDDCNDENPSSSNSNVGSLVGIKTTFTVNNTIEI